MEEKILEKNCQWCKNCEWDYCSPEMLCKVKNKDIYNYDWEKVCDKYEQAKCL